MAELDPDLENEAQADEESVDGLEGAEREDNSQEGDDRADVERDDDDGLEHLEEQLGGDEEEAVDEDSGVKEAIQAWTEGGHTLDEFDDDDQIAAVRFPQLEPSVPKKQLRPDLLHNVSVDISVELGRKEMTVGELAKLKEQEVIELDKLAGEAFEIRINGRLFGAGEVVVVSDLMAVRVTSLVTPTDNKRAN